MKKKARIKDVVLMLGSVVTTFLVNRYPKSLHGKDFQWSISSESKCKKRLQIVCSDQIHQGGLVVYDFSITFNQDGTIKDGIMGICEHLEYFFIIANKDFSNMFRSLGFDITYF